MGNDLSLKLILHQEVQRLLDNFSSVIQARVVFYNARGEVLIRGRNEGNCRFCQLVQEHFSVTRCIQLDRKKQEEAKRTGKCQTYFCHACLREAVMPIISDGELLGFVVFGQCRGTEQLPPELIRKFPASVRSELKREFRKLPSLSENAMDNLTGLMKLLVNYIVRSELITQGEDQLYPRLLRYIEANRTRNITLPEAARHLGRSVSSLSHYLQQNGKSSFKKILIEKRIALAEELLREHPELTIKEAADQAGFSDPYYFSRLYRKVRHYPPRDFRKKELAGL